MVCGYRGQESGCTVSLLACPNCFPDSGPRYLSKDCRCLCRLFCTDIPHRTYDCSTIRPLSKFNIPRHSSDSSLQMRLQVDVGLQLLPASWSYFFNLPRFGSSLAGFDGGRDVHRDRRVDVNMLRGEPVWFSAPCRPFLPLLYSSTTCSSSSSVDLSHIRGKSWRQFATTTAGSQDHESRRRGKENRLRPDTKLSTVHTSHCQ